MFGCPFADNLVFDEVRIEKRCVSSFIVLPLRLRPLGADVGIESVVEDASPTTADNTSSNKTKRSSNGQRV